MVRVGTGAQNQPQEGYCVVRSKSIGLTGSRRAFNSMAAQIGSGPASFLLCPVSEPTRVLCSLGQCPSPAGPMRLCPHFVVLQVLSGQSPGKAAHFCLAALAW